MQFGIAWLLWELRPAALLNTDSILRFVQVILISSHVALWALVRKLHAMAGGFAALLLGHAIEWIVLVVGMSLLCSIGALL
jgi:hypothetical protein